MQSRRWVRRLGPAAAAAALGCAGGAPDLAAPFERVPSPAALAADGEPWDALFTRSSVEGSRGWTGGDGAVSVPLPGARARTLWIFGDSLVTGYDAGARRRVSLPGEQALADTVFGNTIAIHDHAAEGEPARIRFWARAVGPACTPVPGDAPACPPADVTRLAEGSARGFGQFFDHKLLGLAVPADEPRLLWPGDAACLDCDDEAAANDRLLLSFAEVRFCTPGPDDPSCSAICGLTAPARPGARCDAGVAVSSRVIARIENPRDDPASWRGTSIRVAGEVPWHGFLQDGDALYVYGSRPGPDGLPQLLVARAAPEDALQPSRWAYRIGDGWVARATPPAPSELAPVASGASGARVAKISRRGMARYVLIHDRPLFDHFVYVRVSTAPDRFPDVTAATPRLDLVSVDGALASLISALEDAGLCRRLPRGGVASDRHCGLNYHTRAHPQLADSDAHGPSTLPFSYVLPYGPDPGAPAASLDAYRPRFGSIPLDHVSPWCWAARRSCWAGIAYAYPKRAVARGVETPPLAYDVRRARRFEASIARRDGNAELYVGFGAPPTTRAYDCRAATRSRAERCDVRVPPGETTAYVVVRGATSATYDLFVQHVGE